MRKFHTNFLKFACALLLLVCTRPASAQTSSPAYCPTLNGLPDTFYACKNTRPALPIATLGNFVAGTEFLDTAWVLNTLGVPVGTGLTRYDTIATQAYVDLASASYTLQVRSIRPNIAVNSTFDLGNVGFASDYIYHTTTLQMQPNFYMVTDDPRKANITYPNIADHGTSVGAGGNGNMMVVNGSTQPNKVVYRQTVTVIPGETYQLLAFGTALHPLNTAVLEWRVNGVRVDTFYLTPVPGTWSPMQVNYYNAAGTSLTLELVNLELSPDPGNDFALDDITIRPLCIQKDSIYVKAFNLSPLINFTQYYGCSQDTVDFLADTGQAMTNAPPATIPDRYLWNFGDGQTSTQRNPRHIFNTVNQDTFIVKLYVYKDGINPNGTITCVDSASPKIIRRRPRFHAGFIQDKDSICKGDVVSFKDTTRPNTLPVQYFFGTGDSTRLKDVSYTYDTAGVFYVYQIATDQYDCKDTARDTVVVIGPVDLAFSLTDSLICAGQTVRVKTLIDSSYRQYTWSFGDGRIVVDSTELSNTYLTAGNYNISFSATHNICPNVSKTRPIIVLPIPGVNLGSDTAICPTGQPILLQNLYAGNTGVVKYVWNTGDQTPQILVRHDGTYHLTATNEKGCSASDTLIVSRNCYLSIPTIFAPGSEGPSAYFLPRQTLSRGLMSFKMKIYNRWGQQVFETERTDGRGWDGNLNGVEQPTGVYLYFIEATLQNGVTEKYEGNVTLVR